MSMVFVGHIFFLEKKGANGVGTAIMTNCSHIRLRDVAEGVTMEEHVIKFSDWPYVPNDFQNGPDLNSNPWAAPFLFQNKKIFLQKSSPSQIRS